MLSRSAQSLYWIGRHLERAGHLCQLLRLQSEALGSVDISLLRVIPGK